MPDKITDKNTHTPFFGESVNFGLFLNNYAMSNISLFLREQYI